MDSLVGVRHYLWPSEGRRCRWEAGDRKRGLPESDVSVVFVRDARVGRRAVAGVGRV